MATQMVEMDYKVVTQASKMFGTTADMLKTVGKVLEALIQVLRATAFFSGGTSLALANYLENIKNKINNLAKVCQEFEGDLARAVSDHKKGDVQGKRYFGEGVG